MRLSRPRHPRSHRIAGLLALTTAVITLVAACTSPDARWNSGDQGDPGSTISIPPAEWEPCSEVAEDALGYPAPNSVTFECATIKVPKDWLDPENAETFEIALLRARSDRQDEDDRLGSLVINPGGPGGSGIETAVYLSFTLPTRVLRSFDIVGFDPRGVGRSSPVECLSNADKDRMIGAEPDPKTQQEFDAILEDTREMVETCERKYGEDLKFFSTEQTARDMDAIRQAVGDEKLTYLGYSYGTLLGAVYAELFPDRIRAMVLDGAVDPSQNEIEASEGQAAGFERAFGNFARWCKDAGRSQCPIGPDAKATVTKLLDEARKVPVSGPDGRRATAGWVLSAVLYTLYVQDWWPQLSDALAKLQRNDATGVFQIVDTFNEREPDGDYPNSMDVLTTVNCVDEEKSPTVEEVRQLQHQWRDKYPLFGAPLAMTILACAVWPDYHDPYPYGKAEGAPPILVIGTTGDPATPYEQAGELAELLGTGVLVTYEGEGHTAYPAGGCLDRVVNDYLIDLKAPRSEVTCRARR